MTNRQRTERFRRIARLLRKGATYAGIARTLGLSYGRAYHLAKFVERRPIFSIADAQIVRRDSPSADSD